MYPFDHVSRLSSLSIRRAEQEPLPPGWARQANVHCLPQEGECLHPTTYPHCRCCLFAGLSWSRQ